jgi:hypothetical protein
MIANNRLGGQEEERSKNTRWMERGGDFTDQPFID